MKRLRQKSYLKALTVLIVLSALFTGAILLRTAVAEVDTDFYCRRIVSVLPKEGPLSHAQKVTFTTAFGDKIVGWWQSGSTGKAIVIVHGSSGYRGQLLTEGEMLSNEG